MTHSAAQEGSALRSLKPDVLIVGGGVQGLWLLNELNSRGYCALLVERRELGGVQTCHSHVYIHEGHLYRENLAGLSGRLRDVRALWAEFLEANPVIRGHEPSYFGFQNPADADKKEALWKTLGLPVCPEPPPFVLAGGSVRRSYRSREMCLDGTSLVSHLRAGVEEHITLGEVESITTVNVPGTRSSCVGRVSVSIDGVRLAIAPRAVVLAAGAGNEGLLTLASGGRTPLVDKARVCQQLRLGRMLVVTGPKHDLPPLTGVFPDLNGLFIVSRVSDDEIVWLVSDDRSPPLFSVGDWLTYDARQWLNLVLGSLERLAPRVFDPVGVNRLRWGVYDAPKAEGRAIGHLPAEERIEQLDVQNLWAVWPTKLTLAPWASRIVADRINKRLGKPRKVAATLPPDWKSMRRPPPTALEQWRKTPLLPWPEFRRCFT